MPSTDFGSDRNNPGGWGGSGGGAAGSQGGMGSQKASGGVYDYRSMPGARPNTNAIGNWNTGGGLVGRGNQHAVIGPDGRVIGGSALAQMRQGNIFSGLGGKGGGGLTTTSQGVTDARRRAPPATPRPTVAPPPAIMDEIERIIGVTPEWEWNPGVDPNGIGQYDPRGPVTTSSIWRRYPAPIGPDIPRKSAGPLGSGWDERLPQGDQTVYRSGAPFRNGGYRDTGGFDIRNTGSGLNVGR